MWVSLEVVDLWDQQECPGPLEQLDSKDHKDLREHLVAPEALDQLVR